MFEVFWPEAGKWILVSSSVAVLALIALQSVVVWNTVLATFSGVIAAGFAFGMAAALIARSVRRPRQHAH